MAAKKRKPAIQLSNDDIERGREPYPQDGITPKRGLGFSGSRTIYRKPKKKKIMQARPHMNYKIDRKITEA